jgi:hypothetical protein
MAAKYDIAIDVSHHLAKDTVDPGNAGGHAAFSALENSATT